MHADRRNYANHILYFLLDFTVEPQVLLAFRYRMHKFSETKSPSLINQASLIDIKNVCGCTAF